MNIKNIHFVDDKTLVSQLLRLSDDVLASDISSDDMLKLNACDNLTFRALKRLQLSSNY